ncbi:MAG: cyclodeaminase/cyclohydrolase family protein [Planctomycetes bacterium]|nr:cyclodeaminase/cyclohydrolase family protein [Planctomycetota bacterium]
MIDAPFREFVDALGARTPTPGGGAAASCAGAMGAALLTMVLRFTKGRKSAPELEPALAEALTRIERSASLLLPMVERDMASFERVAAAYKLPHDTDEQKVVRSRAIQEGLAGAMVVPEELAHLVRDALEAMATVTEAVGRNILADLGTAASLLFAACRSAELLVRINAAFLHDREQARATLARMEQVVTEARKHFGTIDARVEALLR